MVFSSLSFIFFLLPLVLAYESLCRKHTLFRNIGLIVFSLLFYLWGEGNNVLILVGLSLLNYAAGRVIFYARLPQRKLFLLLGVGGNIACLVYYKYLFWLASTVAQFLGTFNLLGFLAFSGSLGGSALGLSPQPLPLGISFFTFHGISYLIDIYRKEKGLGGNEEDKPPSSLHFFTYFFMFPHLVAGPIVRFAQIQSDVLERCADRRLFTYGLARFIVGLNKKILIANSVAPMADAAFSLPVAQISAADAWLGALAYTVQIYFDFSGYSDMAIGLAAMLGIRFEENFRSPYTSASIREFWRRWHISLSTWFRDYLYIPLGGNKGSSVATYRNLFLVFVVCGLWHGAQFTFLFWGMLHGTLLVVERLGLDRWLARCPLILSRLYCMSMVTVGWVFFRAQDLPHALKYLQSGILAPNGWLLTIPAGPINVLALIAGCAIALFPLQSFASNSAQKPEYAPLAYLINTLLFALSMAILYIGARNPFIYFNF